jgi:carbonic anhydrase
MRFQDILERNRAWVDETMRTDPQTFAREAGQHRPKMLFIGCSDARVPANVITQTGLGEMFVHRNVANLVVPTDTNLLAVVQYAVEVLQVGGVIVCGHYGCGGVKAAMDTAAVPPHVDNWLSHIRASVRLYADELAEMATEEARYERLVELNVIEQVYNLSRLAPVQEAWAAGRTLRLHGCVYPITTGLLRDLGVTMDGSRPDAAATTQTPAAERPRDTRSHPSVVMR